MDQRAAVKARNPDRILEKEAVLMEAERDPAKVPMMDTLEEVAIPMMAMEVVSCLPTTRNTMAMEAARDHTTDTLEVVVNPDLTLEEVESLVLMMAPAPREVPKEVMEVIPRDIRAAVPEREAVKARNHMMALEKEVDLMEAERDPEKVHMMDTPEVAMEVVATPMKVTEADS